MNPQPKSEAQLLLGNQEEFAELISRYAGRLQRFLGRYAVDPQMREDMLQEVLIKTYRGRHHFDPEQKFSSWFFSLALNSVRDLRRKQRRQKAVILEQVPGPERYNPAASEKQNNPEEMLIARQNQRSLRQLVGQLSPNQQAAIWLRYGAELSVSEIGQTMEVPSSTVNNWLFRGREELRRLAKDRGLLEGTHAAN